MSIVVDFGRTSRPGLPCLRAAVGPYRFVSGISFFLLFYRSPHPEERAKHASRRVAANSVSLAILRDAPFGALLRMRTELEHPQMLRDALLVGAHLVAAPGKYDRAGIHDHHVVGKVQRKLDILLHQHDR